MHANWAPEPSTNSVYANWAPIPIYYLVFVSQWFQGDFIEAPGSANLQPLPTKFRTCFFSYIAIDCYSYRNSEDENCASKYLPQSNSM